MNIKSNSEIGERIRYYREMRQMSRNDFCGDESSLSHRQLIRIEQGTCAVGIDKLQFIANRLEVTVSELLGDHAQKLPEEYYKLRRALNKNPCNNEVELKRHYAIIDKIYNEYVELLPEEELLFLEVSERILDQLTTGGAISAPELFDEKFEKLFTKQYYQYYDLLICSYHFHHIQNEAVIDWNKFDVLYKKLLKIEVVHDTGFNTRLLHALGNAAGVGLCHQRYYFIKLIISRMVEIMDEIHDYTLKPNVLIVEAKYYLFGIKDKKRARQSYDIAEFLAKAYGTPCLVDFINKERLEDGL